MLLFLPLSPLGLQNRFHKTKLTKVKSITPTDFLRVYWCNIWCRPEVEGHDYNMSLFLKILGVIPTLSYITKGEVLSKRSTWY